MKWPWLALLAIPLLVLASTPFAGPTPRHDSDEQLHWVLDYVDEQNYLPKIQELLKQEPLFNSPSTTGWLQKMSKPPEGDARKRMNYQFQLLRQIRNSIRDNKNLSPDIVKKFAARHPSFVVRTDSPTPQFEVLATFDALISRMLLKEILPQVKKGLAEGAITTEVWKEEARRADAEVMELQIRDFVIPELIRHVKPILKGRKQLLYVAVGCGAGKKDLLTKETLEATFPELTVTLYCLDPYQIQPEHAFTRAGGILDTTILAPNEQLIDRARAQAKLDENVPVIVTGHYAFHHMGMSYGHFLQSVKGANTVYLFESVFPNTTYQYLPSLAIRLTRDVLMNLGFDALHGTHWVQSALDSPQLLVFEAYYLTDQTLREQSPAIVKRSLKNPSSPLIIETLTQPK
jgi:hypothetical protein